MPRNTMKKEKPLSRDYLTMPTYLVVQQDWTVQLLVQDTVVWPLKVVTTFYPCFLRNLRLSSEIKRINLSKTFF